MRIIINGACGRMGRVLRRCIEEQEPEWETVGVARSGGAELCSLEGAERADCLIDFSHHEAAGALADYALRTGTPLVVATTGHTVEELTLLRRAAERYPVFLAANMSIGIAVLARMARTAAAAFPEADIEIVECHHNRKLDVPSGTALALAREIRAARPDSEFVVGRHQNGLRRREEVGIHSLRMGSVVGMHEIIITTGTQSLTLKHEAFDRRLFAEGALRAAKFIIRQESGMFGIRDMLNYDR